MLERGALSIRACRCAVRPDSGEGVALWWRPSPEGGHRNRSLLGTSCRHARVLRFLLGTGAFNSASAS